MSPEILEQLLIAVIALGDASDDKAADVLMELATDNDTSTRHTVASALGQISGDKAVDILRKLATDNNGDVRCSAAISLGKIGGEKAVEALSQMLNDDDEGVRGIASKAITKFGLGIERRLLLDCFSGSMQDALSRLRKT